MAHLWIPEYWWFAILLQSLLCDPNPNSPANSEAARMYSENRREYNRRVREIVEQSWTAEWSPVTWKHCAFKCSIWVQFHAVTQEIWKSIGGEQFLDCNMLLNFWTPLYVVVLPILVWKPFSKRKLQTRAKFHKSCPWCRWLDGLNTTDIPRSESLWLGAELLCSWFGSVVKLSFCNSWISMVQFYEHANMLLLYCMGSTSLHGKVSLRFKDHFVRVSKCWNKLLDLLLPVSVQVSDWAVDEQGGIFLLMLSNFCARYECSSPLCFWAAYTTYSHCMNNLSCMYSSMNCVFHHCLLLCNRFRWILVLSSSILWNFQL